MPRVRKIQLRSVQGRTQRAQAASMRAEISAAMAKEQRRVYREADILQHRIEVPPLERRARDAQERVRGEQDEEIECAGDPSLHGEHQRA